MATSGKWVPKWKETFILEIATHWTHWLPWLWEEAERIFLTLDFASQDFEIPLDTETNGTTHVLVVTPRSS